MCGIVGFTGKSDARKILLNGLKKLEYRGYDSSGISIFNRAEGRIETYKKQGGVDVLIEALKGVSTKSAAGIGHTRWATHGKPGDVNAHPHMSCGGIFSIVHNGIIENYMQIKDMLIDAGKIFYSQTDTEVAANLLEHSYKGDFLRAVELTLSQLKGSYAFAIMCRDFPDTIIGVRYESPLVIGVLSGVGGTSGKRGTRGVMLASDLNAIAPYTDDIIVPENGDIALIGPGGIRLYNGGAQIKRPIVKSALRPESAELNGFESYMLKEIMQVPGAIRDTVALYDGGGPLNKIPYALLKGLVAVRFIGCGTAYHAGLAARGIIERLCNLSCGAELASEFRYGDRLIDEKTLCVFISQSGETADTLGALKTAKAKGCTTVAITNVATSSITRIADYVLPTAAGAEIAVASTKAYNAQLSCIYAFCFYLARLRFSEGKFLDENYADLKAASAKAQTALAVLPQAAALAKKFCNQKGIFFIGRGVDYAAAQEGSLKLKEISYIFSEAYASGELKHGALALIEKDTPVISIVTQRHLFDKSLSAMHEVKARGASIICISTLNGIEQYGGAYDYLILLPEINELLSPLLSVIPMQLFSYFVTRERGYNPDKPRNLAKSVTVE
jgi:glucosamine--fructose-6-phosphate aminotransferase (isomerizing)